MRRLFDYRGNVRFWLKGYLFLGVAVLLLAMLLYSNHLIGKMRENAEATSRLFSSYIANVLFEVNDEGGLSDLRDVISVSNLPIIVTVLEGQPILWHKLPLPERPTHNLARDEEGFNELVTMDINNPPTERLRRIIELYREYDRINEPIPIRVLGADGPQGYVHYGEPPILRELRMMPFVQLGIFLLFMAVAVQALRYLKQSEQRSLWVGLAKETAHQLGTPLSALLGWVQIIKDQSENRQYDGIASSVEEMEVDIARLQKVTDRFSKIGAQPDLVTVDLAPAIERTVAYFHKRLPQRHGKTTIECTVADDCRVRGNAELLEWVFENLTRNGLDAIGDAGGRVDINARTSGDHVDVLVRDTGRGMAPGQRERAFDPGFTTKKRGWGLGLALSRRIIEDYHGGTIRVVDSRPGHGTTFLVRLPVA